MPLLIKCHILNILKYSYRYAAAILRNLSLVNYDMYFEKDVHTQLSLIDDVKLLLFPYASHADLHLRIIWKCSNRPGLTGRVDDGASVQIAMVNPVPRISNYAQVSVPS